MSEPDGPPAPRRRLSRREKVAVGVALLLLVALGVAAKLLWVTTPEPTRPSGPTALVLLRASLLQGRGMSDPDWPDLVQRSAMEVWTEPRPPLDVPAARKLHTELAHVAGDLARDLVARSDARLDWEARDPESLKIHDGFLAAAGGGPEAFRAWVAGDGADLLRRRMDRIASERPPR